MVQGVRPAEGVRKGGEEPHLQKNARSAADARRLPKAPAFTDAGQNSSPGPETVRERPSLSHALGVATLPRLVRTR